MLISVIIPAYNHEKYIQKAIQSVIDQTYKNIELIIINDGSPDNTHKKIIELIPKCKERFDNFIYINQNNIGLIKTLNKALKLINGEYFCTLGSDDYYYKDKIEKQVNCVKKDNKCVICYGNITYIDSDGNIKKDGKTKHFKKGYVFDYLIFRDFMPLPTIMFKTEVVKEFGGFDERFFLEDYPLLLKITQKYPVCYIKEPLSFYRLHGNNVSSDMIKMIKEVEKILYDYKDKKIYKKAISKWYLRWFYDLAKTNNLEITKEYLQKAKKTNWYHPKFLKAYFRFKKKGIKYV